MTGEPAASSAKSKNGEISGAAVWVACLAFLALLIYFILTNPALIRGELGLVEQGQVVILACALVLMIDTAIRADTSWLRGWMIFVAIGTIYLLGEETSWGQHYFGWGVGDSVFADINDQGETNFHNSSSWLDQKPRALLLLGMVLGTVVHPLVKYFRKGRGLFDKPWWLAPTLVSLAPVVVSQVVALPKKIDAMHALPYSLDLYRWSEGEEFFMYIFFVTYTLSLRQRLLWRKAHGVAPSDGAA